MHSPTPLIRLQLVAHAVRRHCFRNFIMAPPFDRSDSALVSRDRRFVRRQWDDARAAVLRALGLCSIHRVGLPRHCRGGLLQRRGPRPRSARRQRSAGRSPPSGDDDGESDSSDTSWPSWASRATASRVAPAHTTRQPTRSRDSASLQQWWIGGLS